MKWLCEIYSNQIVLQSDLKAITSQFTVLALDYCIHQVNYGLCADSMDEPITNYVHTLLAHKKGNIFVEFVCTCDKYYKRDI